MAVAFGAAAAFAGWNPSTKKYDTTGYVKLKTNAGDYGDTTVFDEPEKWTWPDGKVPDRMDPEADYCYDGASRYSRTPRTRDYVFNARTLAVNGQFHQSSTHWFTTTNMHLVNGGKFVIWGTSSYFTNCTFTVYSDAAHAFMASVAVDAGSLRDGFKFMDTTIRGDDFATLKFHGDRETQKYAAFWWTGDGSDYRGKMIVEMPASTNGGYSRLNLGPVNLAGTLVLTNGSELATYGPDEVKVAGLETEDGSKLLFAAGAGPLTVTRSFVRRGKLTVQLDVERDVTGSVVKRVLMTAPRKSLDLADVDVTDMSGGALPDLAVVRVEDVGTASQLVLTKPFVTLDTGLSGTTGSPFVVENKDCWSDGQLPRAGCDYGMSGKYVYLPSGSGLFTFAGDSLKMEGAATINSSGGSCSGFVCRDLTVNKASFRVWGHDFSLCGGTITMAGPLSVVDYSGRTSVFSVDSELVGAGALTCNSYISASESGSCGQIALTALNTNFTGKIRVTIPSGTQDYGAIPADARMTTLHVSDPRNLGGALDVFTPDALQLEQMSVLKPDSSMTLDTPNRGIRIFGMGRFDVLDRATLTVATPITYAGLLRKEGEGTLALAAVPRFEGGLGSNRLEIAEGTVKGLAADVLAGVALSTKAEGRFVFDIDPKAEGLREFGFAGVEVPEGEGGAQPVLTVGFDVTSSPDAPPAEDWTQALFTVPTARVASLTNALRVVRGYVRYAVSLSVRDNRDGTSTVLVTHRHCARTIDAATYRTALPLFSGAGEVTVPRDLHLEFTGFASNEFVGVRFTVARGGTLRLPEDFGGWTFSPAPKDASLVFEEVGNELIVTVLPVEYAYAHPRGSLLFTGIGRNSPSQVNAVGKNGGGTYPAGGSYSGSEGNSYAFSNLTGVAGVWFDGRLTVEQKDDRTARATWSFTPNADVSNLACLGIDLKFPPAEFLGGVLVLDDTSYAIAVPASGAFAAREASRLELRDAAGRSRAVLALDAPRFVYATVSATSGTLRLYLAPPSTGTFAAGQTYTLSFDLSCEGVVRAPETANFVISHGASWVPVTAHGFVLPGSPLDFSGVCGTGKPAGKYGRVKRVGDHFEFEKLPGKAQRFFGLTSGAATYVYESSARDAGLADLARRGYNATRIHDYESGIVNPDDASQTSFDPVKMRQFDGYVASSISNGLYVIIELYGNHRTPSWRSIGEDRDGAVTRDEAKMLLLVHEGMISNQMEYIRAYLTRKNEFTGRSFVEEPALVGADFVNEWTLGYDRVKDVGAKAFDDLASAWRKWVAAKKTENPTKYKDVSADKIPSNYTSTLAGRLYIQFLREKHETVVRRLRDFLRNDLKFKAPLSDYNGAGWAAYEPVRTAYNDYIDCHFYEDHPNFLEEQFKLPNGFRHGNQNPITVSLSSYRYGKGVPYAFSCIFRGWPFTMTEFNYCSPGRFRFAGGLLAGTVAALQSADGFWQHSYSFKTEKNKMGWFDYLSDPLMPAWSRALIPLFVRGDVKPLRREYVTRLDPAAMRSDEAGTMNGVSVSGTPALWAAWYAKTGLLVSNAVPAGVATSGDWATTMAKTEADVMADLGIARDANGRLPVAGEGQVKIDDVDGTLAVMTERTSGGFAEKGVIDGGALAADIGEEPAAIWVSSLDGAAIPASDRLLLTHLTDVQDEGLAYLDDNRDTQLSWGRLPHLMRRGVAQVEMAAGKGHYTVYALAGNGARRFAVPSVKAGGKLRFTADVGADPAEATYLYEIVRSPGFCLLCR